MKVSKEQVTILLSEQDFSCIVIAHIILGILDLPVNDALQLKSDYKQFIVKTRPDLFIMGDKEWTLKWGKLSMVNKTAIRLELLTTFLTEKGYLDV